MSALLQTSRCKILCVNSSLLVDLLRLDGTRRLRVEGLPADAIINGVGTLVTGIIAFRVFSQEFPEVPEGCVAPELTLTFTEIPEPERRSGRGYEFL